MLRKVKVRTQRLLSGSVIKCNERVAMDKGKMSGVWVRVKGQDLGSQRAVVGESNTRGP